VKKRLKNNCIFYAPSFIIVLIKKKGIGIKIFSMEVFSMKRKLISLTIFLVLALNLYVVTVFAATANPTASTVLVDGKNVAFDAFNINDNNYFKLRDLAFTLNGTAKQFEVGWDGAKNAISLTSGQSYTVVSGEMTGKGGGAKEATPTASKIYLNGREVKLTAYNIDGNNYFKLRDIGEAFDFGVDWDGARNTIVIDTSKGYSVDGGTTTTTPPPTTTVPSVGNNLFVGTWGYDGNGVFTPIEKTSEYIEFKSDGTLIYTNTTLGTQWIGIGNYYATSNTRGLTITANYSISGDAINCTNMLYRWYEKLDSSNTEYTDERKPDTAFPYKFTNGGSRHTDALTFLEINLWPNESGALNKFTGFVKPIDLTTIKGVVNLPSALPDNIAPKGINCIFTTASGDDVYTGQTQYTAYFNCSSETQMKSILAPIFAQLRSAGFVDAVGPEILYVEGTIGGKEVRVTCRYAEALGFYDIDYGEITYEFFD